MRTAKKTIFRYLVSIKKNKMIAGSDETFAFFLFFPKITRF